MTPEEPSNERVTLKLVYDEISRLRNEFNGGLESLRCKMDEQSSNFVTIAQFNERGRRFDGDFAQVTTDVALAKKTADQAIDRVNARIDRMNLLAITQLASFLLTVVGGVIYIMLTHAIR